MNDKQNNPPSNMFETLAAAMAGGVLMTSRWAKSGVEPKTSLAFPF